MKLKSIITIEDLIDNSSTGIPKSNRTDISTHQRADIKLLQAEEYEAIESKIKYIKRYLLSYLYLTFFPMTAYYGTLLRYSRMPESGFKLIFFLLHLALLFFGGFISFKGITEISTIITTNQTIILRSWKKYTDLIKKYGVLYDPINKLNLENRIANISYIKGTRIIAYLCASLGFVINLMLSINEII